MMKKNAAILVKATLALLILIAILWVHSHWAEIPPLLEKSWEILRNIKITYFILAFLTYILSVYLFAVRWQRVLAAAGYDLTSGDTFPIIFGSTLINNITPTSRAGGEGLRVFWANKRYKISYTDGIMTTFFERVVEIIPIALLFAYVLYTFPVFRGSFLSQSPTSNSVLLLLLALAIIIGLAAWKYSREGEEAKSFLKEVLHSWRQLHKAFVSTVLLSSAVWVLDIGRLKFISLALDLSISIHVIAAISVLSLILGIIPITPGGLGIVEGGLISLLLYFGLSLPTAGSFVFLERFISYWLSSLIGLLYLYYYGELRIWENLKSL
jgi:uncharacterized protein (TIRG00374 family)